METGSLFTWDALASMGSASLLVFFIVQYSKSLMDRLVPGVPTDVYAVAVGWAVLLLAQLATGAPADDWRVYVLALFNAFLVAAAAGQMQRKAIEPPGSATTTTTTSSETVIKTEGERKDG